MASQYIKYHRGQIAIDNSSVKKKNYANRKISKRSRLRVYITVNKIQNRSYLHTLRRVYSNTLETGPFQYYSHDVIIRHHGQCDVNKSNLVRPYIIYLSAHYTAHHTSSPPARPDVLCLVMSLLELRVIFSHTANDDDNNPQQLRRVPSTSV